MHTPFFRSIRKWLGARPCPTEQLLAAYADRQLIGEERHTVEHHLADCPRCAEQVAFLARGVPSADSEVPPRFLKQALAFGRPRPSRQIPSWALIGSAATAALLLIFSTMQHSRHREVAATPVPTIAPLSATQPRTGINDAGSAVQLRGSEDRQPSFIYPVAGQKNVTTPIIVRWSPSDQAESYEVELLSDSGTLLWSTRVSSLQAALPRNVHLSVGRTYYLRLSIHQKSGSTQRTKAIRFVAG
jgi:hypothetical protein